MNVPENLKYAESHEWLKEESDAFTCGITDYAQEELSDVVFVELPEIGKEVKKGETLCVVESVKAASDIYAPISGVVTAVNDLLGDAPEKVNADPYGEGWICKIDASDKSELDQLLNADSYQAQIVGA